MCLCVYFPSVQGKPKVLDEKETSVYKRALDREYSLKLKASRAIFSEINKKFPIHMAPPQWWGNSSPWPYVPAGMKRSQVHLVHLACQ